MPSSNHPSASAVLGAILVRTAGARLRSALTTATIVSAVVAAAAVAVTPVATAASTDEWPSFRGDGAQGVADEQSLPDSWDVASGRNVRWTSEIPGTGHSSPVVAGGRLYVTTAVSSSDGELILGDDGGIDLAKDAERTFAWRLYALDAKTGEIFWNKEPYQGRPRANRHVKSSQSNATPATNGDMVVAIFGSEGMVAYDDDGGERWRVDLGVLDPGLFGDSNSQWGHASSPVIDGNRVFVQVDRHADSFIAAYDLATGEELWKVERQEKPVWATPTVHRDGSGRAQLIVLGGEFDRGLDPATGRELWRFGRDLQVKTPTPFVAGDRIVLSGGYRGKELHAVAVDAEGTVDGDELLWTSESGGPYTSTPVAYGDLLYFVRDTGVFTVLDLATGERVHRERLDDNFSASAIASDGRIFLTSETGVVHVRSARAPFGEVARSDMGEPCMATPAVANETLYMRCRSKVTAVGD